MNSRTICMDAIQSDGVHYNLHSLYGWQQNKITREASKQLFPNQRAFILSRSSFVGSGQFAAHWLGDNWSRWSDLLHSIVGSIEFNQFGVPMVGADICGFTGTPTEEMCSRWQQSGAFYPFSRNHNFEGSPPQDPGVWPTVAVNTRNALNVRATKNVNFVRFYSNFYHRFDTD